MRKECLLQCNCHAFHFMEFEWYVEDVQPFIWASASLAVGGDFRKTWVDRVKNAWQVLKGQHAYVGEVILDRERVVKLRNALEDYLWDAGYEAAPFHACFPGCAHPQRTDIQVVTKLCSCCFGRWNNCSNCRGNCTANGCDKGTVET